MSQDQAEQNIQMWKVKKLIKSLDSARGYASPSPSMSCHDVELE
jgi:peptide subunit release factor 1 (eRF1)